MFYSYFSDLKNLRFEQTTIMQKQYISMLLFLPFFISCAEEKEEFILNEEFDSNELGWIEEIKDVHQLKVNDGNYYMSCQDTSYERTSTNSIYKDYLYNLPKIYTITTSIHFSGDFDETNNFGLFLNSGTLDYKFSVYASGKIIVTESDYNKENPVELLSSELDYNAGQATDLKIVINEENFEFFINDNSAGANKFKCKTSAWRDLRIYVSSPSTILVDYIKIKEG